MPGLMGWIDARELEQVCVRTKKKCIFKSALLFAC